MTAALAEKPRLARPRARGWIHWYSAFAAAAMGIVLTVMAASTVGAGAALACSVYSVTVIGLFAVSATYHRHTWVSARARTWMKRADHSMIFLFIAGTYTPMAARALPESTARTVLIVVWAGAIGGVLLKMIVPNAPRWVGVPFYLGLGYVAVFVMPDLIRHGGVPAGVLLMVGGLFYTVGAVIYAIKKPNPWPATFGYHEVFHTLVTVAALCHCVAIWLVLYH